VADKPDEPTKPGSSAFAEAIVSMSGASLDPHDIQPPGADKQSIQAGHEADRFRVRTVLYVPILLVVSALLAFVIVTVLFNSLVQKPDRDGANLAANATAGKPLNARFAQISSTDPNAAVKQPRLEYLKQTEESGAKEDPAYMRSKRPVEANGATWEIRPEDLRPDNFVDPTLHRKILIETGWVAESQKKLAHIPIAEAMATVVANKKLPVRKDPVQVAATTADKAKLSNAGRGGLATPAAVTTPVAAVKKDDSKPPHP